MRQVQTPDFNDTTVYTTAYTQFSGCHFLADESQCKDTYSPDCLNMMPDSSGFPEKRVGWRTVKQLGKSVHGIHLYQSSGTTRFLVHCDTKLYAFDPQTEECTQLFDGAAEEQSFSFPYDGKLYFLDGAHYLCYDGAEVFTVGDAADGSLDGCRAFVPTTSILCRPTGGGTTYQKVNMLTRWRRNTFVTDGTAKKFVVDAGRIDEGTMVSCRDLEGGEIYEQKYITVDYDTGTVAFSAPPEASTTEGTQRLEITFACTVSGYADIIRSCNVAALYGYDAANRVFLSGNRQHRNVLYYSENNDPTYFADLNYMEIGVANFSVVGFLKNAAGELVVLKEHSEFEANIWHVSAEISSDTAIGGVYFPVREGVSGTGCVSRFAQAQLKNDALFVGSFGVYNLATSYNYAKYMSNIFLRSEPVGYRLLHGAGFGECPACVWKNKYMLFVGGHVYVMTDAHDWWYWDNVPARCVCSTGGMLWFGTADGRLCRFNTDMVTDTGDYRMSAYNDDGAAIVARWTTKVSGDGDFFKMKNLCKTGFGVYLKTYPRTGATVSIKPLDGARRYLKRFSTSRFSFNDLDFNAVNFTTQATYTCPVRARLRGYCGLQVVVENAEVNEAFGISQILYRFTYGTFIRR